VGHAEVDGGLVAPGLDGWYELYDKDGNVLEKAD
jgi:hypothetical protein